MQQPTITFVVNGNTYSLCASDAQAMRNIPREDRQTLIALLEAVRHQDRLSDTAVQKAVARASVPPLQASHSRATGEREAGPVTNPERLSGGDIDAVMARLVLEEKSNQKPGLTKQGIYKWVLVSAALIVLLVLVF